MIKDKLANSSTYYSLSDRLILGLEWLKTTDLKKIADGKYTILDEDVYANVQTYTTKNDAPFEAHRKYIDIQYMISGVEKIGVVDYAECDVKEEYDANRDIEFLKCNSSSEKQVLREGDFVILFPHDAHQPSLNYENESVVKKVVVKILA